MQRPHGMNASTASASTTTSSIADFIAIVDNRSKFHVSRLP
jgi:citrate synthase